MTKASPTRLANRAAKAGLMASTSMPDPVVTGAGVEETVALADRSYTLAAPTYAMVGEILRAEMMADKPGAAEVLAAIRDAVEREGGEGLSALEGHEAAEDAWVAFAAVQVYQGPDATDATKAEAQRLYLELIRARRARDRATALAERTVTVQRMRAEIQDAQWQQDCKVVAALLRGWEGPGLPDFPESLDEDVVAAAVPMGDVGALSRRVMALMQPTAAAGKGSAPPSP